jgi:hypothetical protein
MTRAIPFAVALTLVFVLGFTSRSARGEAASSKTIPVYVLSTWTEDADDQADAITQALRAYVQQVPGWSLLQTNQSFETLAIALKCPPRPDPACLQRIGDQLKADHYIWGTMERKKGSTNEVSADLHLWTRGKPDVIVHESYADSLKDPADPSLRAIAGSLFGKLTGAETPAPSMVAGGLETLPLKVAPQSAAAAGPDDGFPTRPVLAYTAIAVGAGLLVAAGIEAVTWINDSNRSNDDRKLVPKSVTDVCTNPLAAAQDACSKSKDAVTASTLGWIFTGVGAALVGTGVWLIVTDHASTGAPADQVSRAEGLPASRRGRGLSARAVRRVELLPSFGPRGGAVDVQVTF